MVPRRRPIQINLTDEEHLLLRQILLAEGDSMAEFFGRCAKEYIAARRNKFFHHLPSAKAAEKPKRPRHPSTAA